MKNITINRKPQDTKAITLGDIVSKLNQVVNSKDYFFSLDGYNIVCRSCANVDLHNKVLALITLWCCANHNKYSCFTRHGYADNQGINIGLPAKAYVGFYEFVSNLENVEVALTY